MAPNTLSNGALNRIFEHKETDQSIYIQVLGSRELSSNRFRLVIWDGTELSQHCIVVSETLKFADFDKFAVFQLKAYTLSDLPKKENVQVMLVNDATRIAKGKIAS